MFQAGDVDYTGTFSSPTQVQLAFKAGDKTGETVGTLA
jgi:hypothetical protein